MAVSLSPSTKVEEQAQDEVAEWELAKQGLKLVLNNKPNEANALFQEYPDSIPMYAGYTFSVFMDALMTFEDEKLNFAFNTLKEMERRCTTENGWLKTVKSKVFGFNGPLSLAQQLENQIILADCQVCIAILTFLQQDFTGYFKGGWVLRKAWKIYQHTYNEIQSLYVEVIGDLPEAISVRQSPRPSSDDEASSLSEDTSPEWQFPPKAPSNGYTNNTQSRSFSTNLGNTLNKNLVIHPNKCNCSCSSNNNLCMKKNDCHSKSSEFSSYKTEQKSFFRKSSSVNSALSSHVVKQRKSSIFSQLSPFNSSLSLSYFASALNIFSYEKPKPPAIDKETVARLMSAISFGFGLFQLGISLLPPSLLKITNFLGFGGNLQNGISNLMFSREGSDMRAPLATLCLLWYYTIVRPFYALDGSNVKASVEIASQLMNESKTDYQQSALFLFFEGRIERLNSNMENALKSFQASVHNACQREIKILSLHEVAWCHLIKLDYVRAEHTFQILKTSSRWSRAFYSYLSLICSGANNNITSLKQLEEIKILILSSPQGTQLEGFLLKRSHCFPDDEQSFLENDARFWKFFIYELLYLWNTLPSCYLDDIKGIIQGCEEEVSEPMVGLSSLIAGSCYCQLRDAKSAIKSFRNCLQMRKFKAIGGDDAHVSAFAQYELGALLIKDPETLEEGKQLLLKMPLYKDYDFEQRLTVRIHDILKNL